jgi:hypothetical protein
MELLPPEVLERIFKCVPRWRALALRLVCRMWRDVIQSDAVWKQNFIERHWRRNPSAPGDWFVRDVHIGMNIKMKRLEVEAAHHKKALGQSRVMIRHHAEERDKYQRYADAASANMRYNQNYAALSGKRLLGIEVEKHKERRDQEQYIEITTPPPKRRRTLEERKTI